MKITQKRILHVQPEEERCVKSLKYYFENFFHLKWSQLPKVVGMLGISTPVEVISFELSKNYIRLGLKNHRFIKFYKPREVDPYPHIEFQNEGYVIYQKDNIAKNLYSVCEME